MIRYDFGFLWEDLAFMFVCFFFPAAVRKSKPRNLSTDLEVSAGEFMLFPWLCTDITLTYQSLCCISSWSNSCAVAHMFSELNLFVKTSPPISPGIFSMLVLLFIVISVFCIFAVVVC